MVRHAARGVPQLFRAPFLTQCLLQRVRDDFPLRVRPTPCWSLPYEAAMIIISTIETHLMLGRHGWVEF